MLIDENNTLESYVAYIQFIITLIGEFYHFNICDEMRNTYMPEAIKWTANKKRRKYIAKSCENKLYANVVYACNHIRIFTTPPPLTPLKKYLFISFSQPIYVVSLHINVYNIEYLENIKSTCNKRINISLFISFYDIMAHI